ncbi:MAG: hypothetical protein K2P94_06515 [Rhodospirillaceae bacterium]|nr:hypothetical protein [Rhodospirillaceae bacterium]
MSETADMLAASAAQIFKRGGWDQIADAGLHRLLLPEDLGGAGDAYEDAVAVATQVGVHALATPLLETMAANWCLAKAGLNVDDLPCGLVLPEGDFLNGRLFCTKPFTVPKDIGRAVIVLGSDIAVMDSFSNQTTASMSLDGIPARQFMPTTEGLDLAELASLPAETPSPVLILALLKAAAMAGAMDAVLELTVDYANTRKQFGRAIGQFQAMQHMIAQLSGDVVAAAACVQHAARALQGPHGDWAVAAAKGFTSEAAGSVAAMAHQVHGAIGFTEDFVLQRYTKCLWTWREDAGSESAWYDLLGSAALRGGSAGLWPAIVEGASL